MSRLLVGLIQEPEYGVLPGIDHSLGYKLKIKSLPSVLVSVCDMEILGSIFNNFLIWSSVVEVLHSVTKCKILNFGTFRLVRLFPRLFIMATSHIH